VNIGRFASGTPLNKKVFMQAHRRINNLSYGPEAIKVISRAFDEAWSVVGGNFIEENYEQGRLRLAEALLSVARDCRNVESLKLRALKAMALSYADRPFDGAKSKRSDRLTSS